MRKLTLIALTVLVSLVSVAQAGDFYTKYKGDKRRGEPTEDSALVYVFRPATMGAAIRTWSFADDQLIIVSRSKSYSFTNVPAGKHLFWSKAENTTALELELEAGETYYLQQAIRMGLGKARVKLKQVSAEDAEKFFKKCSYTEPTEEGRQRAVEIAENRLDRAKKKAGKK